MPVAGVSPPGRSATFTSSTLVGLTAVLVTTRRPLAAPARVSATRCGFTGLKSGTPTTGAMGTTGVTGALGAEVWLLPLAAVVATTVNV